MTSRFRLALVVGSLSLAGCADSFNAGPLRYVESERLDAELKDKPKLRAAVRKGMDKLFGPDPQHIRVPEGAGLPNGGIRLANYVQLDGKRPRIKFKDPKTGDVTVQEGGYALYRHHCLHCHGVSGAGDGPTAAFLYPRPRDYRKGLYKFTSTATGAKPTRDDLRKTIRYGLHGTSMPAFDAQMSASGIEQVIDYVIFLSMRGETELALIDEAMTADENDPQSLSDEILADVSKAVFNKWKAAESQVVNPPVPRTPSSRASVLRGRELFLGLNKAGNKVDCTSCHGPQAVGDGPSFVAQDVFNYVVFAGSPSGQQARLDELVKDREEEVKEALKEHPPVPSDLDRRVKEEGEKLRAAWKNSLDDWGNPFRPANLNRGVYKGGRRPIDLYWRIAKGINGAKMPAHYPTIEPEKIWDLVNFVLALPYEPELLEGATLPGAVPTPPGASVARR